MKLNRRQKFVPEMFGKTIHANILPRTHFHLAMLTVIDMMSAWSAASTAAAVPMAKKARLEYDGTRTLDGHETKIVCLLTISPTTWYSLGGKQSGPNLLPRIHFHMLCLTVYSNHKLYPLLVHLLLLTLYIDHTVHITVLFAFMCSL